MRLQNEHVSHECERRLVRDDTCEADLSFALVNAEAHGIVIERSTTRLGMLGGPVRLLRKESGRPNQHLADLGP